MPFALAIAAALAIVNLWTFLAFAVDKRAARGNRRRISEATLLKLAFFGGSPAAKLAQSKLRHKTRKQPFARRLNRIVALQIAVVVLVIVVTIIP